MMSSLSPSQAAGLILILTTVVSEIVVRLSETVSQWRGSAAVSSGEKVELQSPNIPFIATGIVGGGFLFRSSLLALRAAVLAACLSAEFVIDSELVAEYERREVNVTNPLILDIYANYSAEAEEAAKKVEVGLMMFGPGSELNCQSANGTHVDFKYKYTVSSGSAVETGCLDGIYTRLNRTYLSIVTESIVEFEEDGINTTDMKFVEPKNVSVPEPGAYHLPGLPYGYAATRYGDTYLAYSDEWASNETEGARAYMVSRSGPETIIFWKAELVYRRGGPGSTEWGVRGSKESISVSSVAFRESTVGPRTLRRLADRFAGPNLLQVDDLVFFVVGEPKLSRIEFKKGERIRAVFTGTAFSVVGALVFVLVTGTILTSVRAILTGTIPVPVTYNELSKAFDDEVNGRGHCSSPGEFALMRVSEIETSGDQHLGVCEADVPVRRDHTRALRGKVVFSERDQTNRAEAVGGVS